MSPRLFLDLPLECSQHILIFLSVSKIGKDVALLSKYCRVLAKSEGLWKLLYDLAKNNWKWVSSSSVTMSWKDKYRVDFLKQNTPLVLHCKADKCLLGFACEDEPSLNISSPSVEKLQSSIDFTLQQFVQRFGLLNITSIFRTSDILIILPEYDEEANFVRLKNLVYMCSRFLFDNFGFRHVRFESSSACCLRYFSQDSKPGVVLYADKNIAYANVVLGGGIPFEPPIGLIENFTFQSSFAGKCLTAYTKELLVLNSMKALPRKYVSMEIAKDIKESLCYARVARSSWRPSANEMFMVEAPYDLKIDGGKSKKVYIQRERYQVAESVFAPKKLIVEIEKDHRIPQYSAQEIVRNIVDCAASSLLPGTDASSLYSNVAVCGGGFAFPGFAKRLQKELYAIAGVKVKVHRSKSFDKTDFESSVWRGACVGALQPKSTHSTSYMQKWVSLETFAKHKFRAFMCNF